MALTGIFGAGGCGRGVLPIARTQIPEGDRLVFVDDGRAEKAINGHECLTFGSFCEQPESEKSITLAIANGKIRKTLAERCRLAGIGFQTLIAHNAIFMDNVTLGEGAVLSPFTTVTCNVTIGCHFHCNLYSYVEHDCVVGDFVTFAPAVHCNGNVQIGDGAYIGSNAVIKQGLSIGTDARVGMGAVVLKDVPGGATVVGNPARPI